MILSPFEIDTQKGLVENKVSHDSMIETWQVAKVWKIIKTFVIPNILTTNGWLCMLIAVRWQSDCHRMNFKRISSDVRLDRNRRSPFTYTALLRRRVVQEEAALSGNRFLGDTAFRFDFTFFVEEVDGLHRTQSAHVHCPSSQGILNSHWAKTVTSTTPIGPSIEVHLYPWVFEEILSPFPSSPLSLFLSLALLFSFLPLSLSRSLSLLLSFSPLHHVSSSRRDEASVRFRRCIHTCVSADTRGRSRAHRDTCTTRCTPALFLAKVAALFLYIFLCSSLPSFDSRTLLVLAASLRARSLFASVFQRRETERESVQKKGEKERSKMGWRHSTRRRG